MNLSKSNYYLSKKDYYPISKEVISSDVFISSFCCFCHTKLAFEARFCHMCAKPVLMAVTPQVETRVRVEYVKVCPVCNHDNHLEANECKNCCIKFRETFYNFLHSFSEFPFKNLHKGF